MSDIKFIKFLIVNDYGQNCGEGIFNISRLLSVPNQKGIFTVNIT